jgi:hypothetical protein
MSPHSHDPVHDAVLGMLRRPVRPRYWHWLSLLATVLIAGSLVLLVAGCAPATATNTGEKIAYDWTATAWQLETYAASIGDPAASLAPDRIQADAAMLPGWCDSVRRETRQHAAMTYQNLGREYQAVEALWMVDHGMCP